MAAGIYLHIPFCAGKCPYCDFYSLIPRADDPEHFTDAMLRAIADAPDRFEHADTLYFGGGTPALLTTARLLRLRDAAAARFSLTDSAEVTLEANPCSVTPDDLARLRAGGFNRISFGVQSMDDSILHTLGRRHSAAQAAQAIENAGRAGFSHLSADLILAVPDSRVADVEASIDALAALPIDHLSAYLLSREPGTPFFSRYPDADDDFAADCYLAAVERLAQHGFTQYEISSFSRGSDAQSRHNLKYWLGDRYLGIGPAAHSFDGTRRFFFPRDLPAFSRAPNPWSLCVDDGIGGGDDERLMLGLRLSRGISLSDFPAKRDRLLRQAAPLVRGGFATLRHDTLALTPRGFLVSNSILASLL